MSTYTVQDLGQDQQAALEAVLEKAAQDPEVRRRLQEEPAAVIEETTGMPLPEGTRIKFFDASAYDFAFILPDPVTEELNEDELEAVAGGNTANWVCGVDDVCGADLAATS